MNRPVSSASAEAGNGPVPRAINSWKTALLAGEGVLLYVLLRLLIVGGVGAFPAAGKVHIGPGVPSELKIYPDRGYDGQYVYRLAIDPFTTHATAHGITLDLPGYRQQRIMTALLGHIVSWIPGVSIGTALIVVNSVAIVVAVVAGTKLAADFGRDIRWGIALALPACLLASLAADLTEPVEWAAVLVAIVAARRCRWGVAAIAFSIAMLARETATVILAGYVVESVVVIMRFGWRRESRRIWLVLPIVIEAAWQMRLWQVWGSIPALSGLRNTGAVSSGTGVDAGTHSRLPLVGIAENFFAYGRVGKSTDIVLAVSNIGERIVLLAIIIIAAHALISRRSQAGLAITASWILAATLALSLGTWQTDIQFLRAAMEVWGLSILILLGVRTRLSKATLIAAMAITAWVALYFLPRV